MKLSVVMVLLLAGTASGAIEKRIVGGKTCKTGRPYHVQIQSVQGGKPCGGSLINTRWVITASHCGEQHVQLKNKKLLQVIAPAKQFTYKDEEGHAHDLMLIRLNEDVSAKVPTIQLPVDGCTKPEAGKKVEVGGWGANKADALNSKIPKKLQCAITDLVACGENDKPGESYVSDEEGTMCAFRPGIETCYGDAGSAVEYNNFLHGIIVSEPVDKCANVIVMVNICHYRKWIDETMMNNP